MKNRISFETQPLAATSTFQVRRVMTSLYLAVLFSVLAFALSVVSFFYFKSYLRRRTGQEHILSEIRDEIDSLLKTIDNTTERDISLVEERERKLKSLLEEADKRLRNYSAEVNKYNSAVDTYALLMKKEEAETVSGAEPRVEDAAPARASAEKSYRDLGKNRYRPNPGAVSSAAESAPKYPASVPGVVPAFPLPSFTVKNSYTRPSAGAQIRELARAGISPPVIASLLGISISEVEFAAALLERRDADKR